MADAKGTALPAAAAVTDDDLLYMVDDPSGTPVSKKLAALVFRTYLLSTAATFASTVTLNADPVSALQAATKQYVDNLAAGLDVKASARVASTANLTLSGAQTIDGVSAIAGDRVLAKDQTAPAENGIYVVAAGAWTRATDMDAWTEVPGANVWVEEGTAGGDKAFICTSNAGGTINTTAITWTQFGGTGAYQAASAVLTALAGASANGQSLITAADYAAMRTLLGLVIGTNVQAFSANLTAVVKNNFAASAAPAVTDDTGSGYAVGSIWLWAATGRSWRCRDASASAAKWVEMDGGDHPGYISGNWYMPITSVATGAARSTGSMCFVPFVLKSRLQISGLGVRITTGVASGSLSLAIYANNPLTSRPTGNCLTSTGNLSTASTGQITTTSLVGGNVTLEPGIYWAAYMVDSTAGTGNVVIQVANPQSHISGPLIGTTTVANFGSGGTSMGVFLTASQTYGSPTWPDVTSATYTESTSGAANGPAIIMKAA